MTYHRTRPFYGTADRKCTATCVMDRTECLMFSPCEHDNLQCQNQDGNPDEKCMSDWCLSVKRSEP
jgi:hypothetical protein